MTDFETYRARLEKEQSELVDELTQVGVEVEGGWVPKGSDLKVDQADVSEVADSMEDASEHVALVEDLNVRYQNVVRALAKIDAGTYGKDEFDGEPIEEDRLQANPAARTRKANMEREGELE